VLVVFDMLSVIDYHNRHSDGLARSQHVILLRTQYRIYINTATCGIDINSVLGTSLDSIRTVCLLNAPSNPRYYNSTNGRSGGLGERDGEAISSTALDLMRHCITLRASHI